MKSARLLPPIALLFFVFMGLRVPHAAGYRGGTNWGQSLRLAACARQETEEQLLMSTIRLIVETWTVIPGTESYTIERSLGHATVMGGRYLVTHNHYQPGLDPRAIGDDETFAIVYLFDHKGELFYRGMLSHFRLVVEDTETLVLSHEDEDFFGRYGLPSAAFAAWPALGLHAGMEVAQVDWDGETTRVDWVTVADVIVDDGTPRLVLDDGLTRGASGGGIFWNGVHVANNWRYQEQIDGAGIVIDTVTSVALNSVDVARP